MDHIGSSIWIFGFASWMNAGYNWPFQNLQQQTSTWLVLTLRSKWLKMCVARLTAAFQPSEVLTSDCFFYSSLTWDAFWFDMWRKFAAIPHKIIWLLGFGLADGRWLREAHVSHRRYRSDFTGCRKTATQFCPQRESW